MIKYWLSQYHLFWLYIIPFYEPEYAYHLRQYNKYCRELGIES